MNEITSASTPFDVFRCLIARLGNLLLAKCRMESIETCVAQLQGIMLTKACLQCLGSWNTHAAKDGVFQKWWRKAGQTEPKYEDRGENFKRSNPLHRQVWFRSAILVNIMSFCQIAGFGKNIMMSHPKDKRKEMQTPNGRVTQKHFAILEITCAPTLLHMLTCFFGAGDTDRWPKAFVQEKWRGAW